MQQAQWSQEKKEAYDKAWAKIVAKAWNDETFKERLLKDPSAVLKENGITSAPGCVYKITQNTDKEIHLVLPQKPHGQLTEEALEKFAGASNTASGSGLC